MKTNYLFYKIMDKSFPTMGKWWVLVINTPKRLVKYQESKSKRIIGSYFKAKAKLRNCQHLNEEEFVLSKMLEFRDNRKTMIDDINILTDTMISPMTRFFLDGKIPLINPVGGYRFLDKTVKVLDEFERAEMVWPDDTNLDIKVSRWPEGTHYYAKVGKYDVQDEEGNVKWATHKQAKTEAKKFLNKLETNGITRK